jgi:hypothetical protein
VIPPADGSLTVTFFEVELVALSSSVTVRVTV